MSDDDPNPRHDDREPTDDREPATEPAAGSQPADARDREPGAHPQVERSGRSRTTGLLLVIALVAVALMYALIWFGIVTPGQ